MKKRLFLMWAVAFSLSAHSELVTYPVAPDVDVSDDYTVSVREPGGAWHEIAVYPVKVDRVTGTRHKVEIASMRYFDFSDKVEVKVVSHGGMIEQARIRPLSYSIAHQANDSSITFSLDRPANLSVEFNGDIFHNLHLFANPIDTLRPSKAALKRAKRNKNLIYFAPGVHTFPGDTLRIASNTTVYVDGGARVKATLIADGVENVNIFGRGEVHPEGRGEGVSLRRSKNIKVDGIIVTQLPAGNCDSVWISNVKAISSYNWGDGMNVFASNNICYDGVFCRNSDDCSTIYATRKGFGGGCRNITMKNSTLWADVAHPIMIGLHGNAEGNDVIENVLYRNIDILDHQEMQLDYQGCFTINCGDNNLVRNVVFDDIRVEDFRLGQLLNIRIFYNKKYCLAPGRGIHNVLFKDIVYNGRNAEISIISGYNSERKVSHITFDNLVINGKRISDDMPDKPKWYKTGDMGRIFIGEHVEDVVFK